MHANERFQAALGIPSGACTFTEREDGRRLDGEATACDVTFKVGRATRTETFSIVGPAELRAVLRTVLDQFAAQAAADGGGEDGEDEEGDGRPTSLELLKPFKMAHASPRMFWNLARQYNGDIGEGLRTLVPEQDWAFLEEREKRRSGKATANARQAAEAEAVKAARRAAREAARAAPVNGNNLGAVAEEEEAGPIDVGDADVPAAAEEEEEEDDDEEEEEPDADDADGWEALGKKKSLEGEYDYACMCLNRALEIRIMKLGGRSRRTRRR